MAMLLYMKVDLGTVCNSFCEATVCKELVFGHYIFGFDNSISFCLALVIGCIFFPWFSSTSSVSCMEKHRERKLPFSTTGGRSCGWREGESTQESVGGSVSSTSLALILVVFYWDFCSGKIHMGPVKCKRNRCDCVKKQWVMDDALCNFMQFPFDIAKSYMSRFDRRYTIYKWCPSQLCMWHIVEYVLFLISSISIPSASGNISRWKKVAWLKWMISSWISSVPDPDSFLFFQTYCRHCRCRPDLLLWLFLMLSLCQTYCIYCQSSFECCQAVGSMKLFEYILFR